MKVKYKLVYFFLFACLLFSQLASSLHKVDVSFTAVESTVWNVVDQTTVHSIGYTSHSPIRVQNDVDLAAVASSGTGTMANPYIIEGLEILTTNQHNIHINGTTKHFTIQGCHLQNDGNYHGVYIDNTSINTTRIVNNVCEYTDSGIYVDGAENATIMDNKCTNSQFGIKIWNSANSSVINNNCSANDDSGIWPYSSPNSMLLNNTITAGVSSGYSIKCHDSINITLINNTLYNHGVDIYSSESSLLLNNSVLNARDTAFLVNSNSGSSDNSSFINNTIIDAKYGLTLNAHYCTVFGNTFIRSTHAGIRFWSLGTTATITNNTFIEDGINLMGVDKTFMLKLNIQNNTVNGLPLGYFKSYSDTIIQAPHGQVILVDCDSVTVRDQNCSYTNIGLAIYYSNFCKVNNSAFNHNIAFGIYSGSSTSTIIDSCMVENTVTLDQIPAYGEGIHLTGSGYSQVMNSSCQANAGGGIYLTDSAYSQVEDNYCSENDNFGIKIELSIFVYVINNTCQANNGEVPGIFIYNTCDESRVDNNTCIGEYIAIQVDTVSNNVDINYNIIHESTSIGIFVKTSESNTIGLNNITSYKHGIVVEGDAFQSCDSTWIVNNTIHIIDFNVNEIKTAITTKLSPFSYMKYNNVVGGGIYCYTDTDYSTSSIESNLINGEPLMLLISNNSVVLDANTVMGQLILVGCNTVTVKDHIFRHLYAAITIEDVDDLSLYNVTMERNYYGMDARKLTNSEIIGSRLAYNSYGANLVDCNSNVFYLNTFLFNNVADLIGSVGSNTLYNSATQQGNYWSVLPIPTEDLYGRGVIPEISYEPDDISCDQTEIDVLYPSVYWNVSDDNLASYIIYIDNVQTSTGALNDRFEMIIWNLSDYITEVGNYQVSINVTDHDGFSSIDSFQVEITTDEPSSTTGTSSTTTTTPQDSSSSTSTTSSEERSSESESDTTPAFSPGFTLLQGLLVVVSLAIYVQRSKRHN